MAKTATSSSVSSKADVPAFFISQLFSESWQIFKKRWLVLLGFLIGYIALSLIGNWANETLVKSMGMPVLFFLLYYLFSLVIGMGFTKILIKLSRDEDAGLSDFFAAAPYIIKYVLGNLLYMLIVVVGILLLVVPGIVWAIKYMYIPYLIIDKGMGPLQAMRASAKMTNGVKWDLVGFSMASALLMYSGLILLIVGVFVTIPVAMIAMFRLYTLMTKRPGVLDA